VRLQALAVALQTKTLRCADAVAATWPAAVQDQHIALHINQQTLPMHVLPLYGILRWFASSQHAAAMLCSNPMFALQQPAHHMLQCTALPTAHLQLP
jgi:hypothetical protein